MLSRSDSFEPEFIKENEAIRVENILGSKSTRFEMFTETCQFQETIIENCLSDPSVSKQRPCYQGTEFKNHQSQEHSDHVFDSVEDPIYDKVLFSFARQP